MNKKKNPAGSLENFDWDKQVSEIDFFGENAPEGMVIGTEENKPEVENAPTKIGDELEEESKKQEEEEEDTLKDAFTDIELQEEVSSEDAGEDTGEDSEKESSDKEDSYKSLYTALKSNGVFEEDEENSEEPSEIDADFLLEKIDTTVEKRLEESIKNLPQELRNIIKFVHNGGDMNEILSQYSDTVTTLDNINLDDELDQERVLRIMLTEDGQDEEIINSQIEFYKESGKLKNISEKLYNKWKEEREEEINEGIKRQEQARRAAIENQKVFKAGISQYVSENKNIKGLSIGKDDIRTLPDYISTASIKLEDGRRMTPFYRDLFETMKDKEKLVILAKLVKNGFDFSDIKKDAVTKQTKEVKQDIQRQKKSTKEAHKRLIDYLD